MGDIREFSIGEMQEEIQRRECAYNGHGPSTTIRGGSDGGAIKAYCRCGKVSWLPQPVTATVDGQEVEVSAS